jgi:hypothetical protein
MERYPPLDEDVLVRPDPAHILPLVVRVLQHTHRRAFADWEDQSVHLQVLVVVHAPAVAQRERHVECWAVYWPPEVDDLEATLYALRRLGFRQVPVDARDGGLRALVNIGPPIVASEAVRFGGQNGARRAPEAVLLGGQMAFQNAPGRSEGRTN